MARKSWRDLSPQERIDERIRQNTLRRIRVLRTKENGGIAPVPAHRHGTLTTYIAWNCHCDDCLAVARVNRSLRTAREREQRRVRREGVHTGLEPDRASVPNGSHPAGAGADHPDPGEPG